MIRVLTSVSVVAMSLALVACGHKTEQQADAAANTVEATADMAGAKIENVVEEAKMAVTPTPSAQDFVNSAAKSDAFEIAAAKLAQAKAASADVKAFAAEMIKAHTESTTKIKAAAAKASPALTPDPALTKDQEEDLADLGKLSGAKFDEDYIDGQVEAHKSALLLMQAFGKDGDVPSLKTAASEISPIVEHHLSEARKLETATDK